jgi:hypothetical protein
MDRKPFKRNRKPFNKIETKKEYVDGIWYRTKEDGPKVFADWQLQLRAIAICMDNHDNQIINEDVDRIYQDLIRRGK